MYLHCPGSNEVIHSYFTHRSLHSTDGVSESNKVAALCKKRALWARLRNGIAGSHPVRRMDVYTHTHTQTYIRTYTYTRTYKYTMMYQTQQNINIIIIIIIIIKFCCV